MARQDKCNVVIDENVSTLNTFAKIGYALGHVLNDLCATVWFSYTLLFFKDVLGMSNQAGTFMMLGQVSDAVFSAIVGFMTDRYSTKRNWHIVGTAIVLLSFPFLFMLQRDALPYWANLFYFIIFIILFQLGWPIVQITHLAIIPELSRTERDRSELNTVRYSMSIFSNITVFVIAWVFWHIRTCTDQLGPNDFDKFQHISLILCAVGIVTSFLFYVSLTLSGYDNRRQEKLEKSDETSRDNETSNLKIMSVLRSSELYKVAFLYTFSRLFLVICIIYIPIWLNSYIKANNNQNVENIATIPLVFFISSFAVAFFLKYINHKMSHKMIYCVGSIISIFGCLWISISSSINVTQLFGIATLLGAGSSITQISSLCITANMIGAKSANGGLIYSIITVCDKLISGIIIFTIETFETNGNYYSGVLTFNGIAALLGLAVLMTFKSRS